MNNKVIASILLAGAMLGACTDAEEATPECQQVERAPKEFLDYWFFPTGSYWVYRQRGSQPAVYDTVTVTGTTIEVPPPGNEFRVSCREYYEMGIVHSNRRLFPGISSNDGFRGREYLVGSRPGASEYWFVNQRVSGYVGNDNMIWTHPRPTLTQELADGVRLADTLAVQVPAGTFRRSVHFKVDDFRDSTRESYVRHFYLARGVGYTKIVYANIGTWELVDYHLN